MASEALFQQLVAERSAIGYKLSQYLGQPVVVRYLRYPDAAMRLGRVLNEAEVVVVEVSPFWVNVRFESGDVHSIPLPRLQLGFEPARDRLILEVQP